MGYDKQARDIKTLTINDKTTSIDELTNAYTYDSNGNRTKHHNTHYTYEPNSDRLSTITTKYDKDNIVKTTHYTYNNLGNPAMITTKDHKGDIINQRALDYIPDGQIKSIKDTIQDKQGNS